MSARKTAMTTGGAIDDNDEIVGEEGSEITVKCVSGKEYRRLCREDILASKTNVKANCYCNVLSGVEKLRRTLSESEFEDLVKTPFGHLVDVGNLKWVNGQLLILLALNYVEPMEPDSDAISFHIRDRVVSFKKTDFALITGFKFGCPTEQEKEYTGTSDINDLSRLNAYPWGDEIWDLLVEDMAKCSLSLRTSKKDRFTFPRFLMALQIWAFETFPGLVKREVCEMIESRRHQWPRALLWAAPTLTNHIVLEEVIFSHDNFEWIGMKATALEIGKENVKCLFLNTPTIEGDESLKLLEKVTKLEEMVAGLVAANVLDRKLLVSLRGKVKGMQRAHGRHAVLVAKCLKKFGLLRRRNKGSKKSRQHAEDGPSFDLGIDHGGNEDSMADQEEGSEDNVNLGGSDCEIENPTQLNDLDDTINSVDTQILLERRAVMVENDVEKHSSEDMGPGGSDMPIADLGEEKGVSICSTTMYL
ncbi:unnamed protein product [Cuscuta campestris]|uniref:DUF1985 domain-containing protein n=1 Tax=Cuscuta campestris TaxID=132261 RepID=A0A484LSF5_9ASTE|nr:unnamed protein product [Cuscuta campestris]